LPPPPGRAPRASACEPYRELIAAALDHGRDAVAIWRDLVDDHGFPAQYASVSWFSILERQAFVRASDATYEARAGYNYITRLF
jgi:hypothetical protein